MLEIPQEILGKAKLHLKQGQGRCLTPKHRGICEMNHNCEFSDCLFFG
jgi:hypothetical protein